MAAFVAEDAWFAPCEVYEYDMEVFTDILEDSGNNEDAACRTTLTVTYH